jgi:hypothetical protein
MLLLPDLTDPEGRETVKSTLAMKKASEAKKISVRRTGDVRLTTAAFCDDSAYWVPL